jgi:DNA polymerase IV
MNLPFNHNTPTIMHIDLNSCFATVEQQAYPSLRGKPIAIAAYTSPGGCVLAPSIEAKRYGIKVGMTVRDAKLLCREIIIRDPDPQMIKQVHIKFKKVLSNYSPYVVPKSIDELVIDFTGTFALKRGLVEIGKEIKQEIRKNVGEWISCNVGISTNRFLAKLAAGLHKPDGLDVITHQNLKNIYSSCDLIDLNGINRRFEARLNASGIFTPLEFLSASLEILEHNVFKSINGYYWYLRLRGWEIDAVKFGRKSYGQSYALKNQTSDPKEIAKLLMKLCEKMGRRLRGANYRACGIHVSCIYKDFTYWHMGRTLHTNLYTTKDLYTKALWVLNQQPEKKILRELAVSCFHLSSTSNEQMDLFSDRTTKMQNIQKAADSINNKWGEYVITPALMMGMNDLIIDRIAFGGMKELEGIY